MTKAKQTALAVVESPVVKGFSAWSYSRLKLWEQCPLQAKLQHLDKLGGPPGPPLLRGTEIHALAEAYVKAPKAPKVLPPALLKFAEDFKTLRKARNRQTELEVALTSTWSPTTWFGADAWLRAKIDCIAVSRDGTEARIIDYKTGKVRPDDVAQLGLYAILAYILTPGLERVEAELWYLDHGEPINRAYVPGDIPNLKRAWEARVKPMFADQTFAPTQNWGCKWCTFKQGEGGQCKF